jgi:hypothetical protein
VRGNEVQSGCPNAHVHPNRVENENDNSRLQEMVFEKLPIFPLNRNGDGNR